MENEKKIHLHDAVLMHEALFDKEMRAEYADICYILFYDRAGYGESKTELKIKLSGNRKVSFYAATEGKLEVVLYLRKKDDEPLFIRSDILPEKKDDLFIFDAAKFLKNNKIEFRPADKDNYDSYAFEFNHLTSDRTRHLSRAYVTDNGFFYWTYSWLDWSYDNLHIYYKERRKDREGKLTYYERLGFDGGIGLEETEKVESEIFEKLN